MYALLGYKTRKNFLITYAGVIFLAIVAYIVRSFKFNIYGQELQIKITIISIVMVSSFLELLRFTDRYLERVMPFEKGIGKRVMVQLLIGTLTGFAFRFVIYYFAESSLPIKLDELFIATTWFLYIFLPTGINLGFFTVHFIERWKKTVVLTEKLEREKSQVQFDNLKNQLNPHFLFNALTSLNSLIHEDQKLASEFLQQLAKVYRYVLQNKDKTIVSLGTELDFIQHYVSLLHTRFRDSLTISFDIDDAKKEMGIVPVTLQILIENALKHNVVDKAKPLTVNIYIQDDYLCVSNNLQIKKRVEESNQQGLENLKSLYQFLVDKPVLVESTSEKFIIKVPLL